MSLPVRFHPLAEQDLLDTWSCYEQQREGLGDRFVDAVRATIEQAAQWPSSGSPTVHSAGGEVEERKIATAGFPYAVRYRTVGQLLVVMAVYHQHRHPGFGSDRSC